MCPFALPEGGRRARLECGIAPAAEGTPTTRATNTIQTGKLTLVGRAIRDAWVTTCSGSREGARDSSETCSADGEGGRERERGTNTRQSAEFQCERIGSFG